MTRYLLAVGLRPGAVDTPMHLWREDEVSAHLAYSAALHDELVASGELVAAEVLDAPALAVLVTSDGAGAPAVRRGPFSAIDGWWARYQIVDVASEERAVEIAARVSAVPGPGGAPLGRPIIVRRLLDDGAPDDDGARRSARGDDARG